MISLPVVDAGFVPGRFYFPKNGRNKKLGAGVVGVKADRASCPARCPFLADSEAECFGRGFTLARKWSAVARDGWEFSELVTRLRRAVWKGRPWRFGVVGDLPADNGRIRRDALEALASVGGDGWCYTHHNLLEPSNLAAVRAVAGRFTVNQSCDTIEQAEACLDAGVPATMVGPAGMSRPVVSERGSIYTPCPAALPGSSVTCARCTLCRSGAAGRTRRRVVVVFPAHGDKVSLARAAAIVERSGLLELGGRAHV